MKKATKQEKEAVVKIICDSFNKNPHLNYIIKKDNKRDQRFVALAEFIFAIGMHRNSIYITGDNKGIVIMYRNKRPGFGYYEYWQHLKLAFKVIGIFRAFKVMRLESRIRKNREKGYNSLYIWFLGIANDGLGTNCIKELMKFIFDLSSDQNLPIYAETSLERNSIIFSRFGFQKYLKLETGIKGLTIWFMKRTVI